MFCYADAAGHPTRLPACASGFWQSKVQHLNQEELLEVARECRRRGLPLSVIVADYYHWTAMGGFKLDPAEYPDPPRDDARARQARDPAHGLRLADYLPRSENYTQFSEEGRLVGSDQGVEVPVH